MHRNRAKCFWKLLSNDNMDTGAEVVVKRMQISVRFTLSGEQLLMCGPYARPLEI
jgi:hypothetical protein